MMLSSRCVMHALRTRRTSNNLNLLKFCSKVDGTEQKPTAQPTSDQTTADKEEEELLRALELRSQRYSAAIKTLAPVVLGMYLGNFPTVCQWLVPGLFYQSWIKEDSTGIGEWLQNKGPQRAVEKGKRAWDNWNPDVRKIVAGGIMEGALKKAVEESGLKDLVDEFQEPYATIAKVSIEIAQKGMRHTITSYLVKVTQDDSVKQRLDLVEKQYEEMMTLMKQQGEELKILKAERDFYKKKEIDDHGVAEDDVGDDQGVEEDAVGAKEVSVVEEVADEHVVSTGEIVVVGKQEEEE